jgi:hypothetical protein
MKARRRAGKMRGGEIGWRSEERSRFLKKAAQKLPLCGAIGFVGADAHGPDYKSFFATFCSQKVVFLLT